MERLNYTHEAEVSVGAGSQPDSWCGSNKQPWWKNQRENSKKSY